MLTHRLQWVTVLLMAMVLVAYSGVLLAQDADTPAADKPAAKPAAKDKADEEKPTPAEEKKDEKKADDAKADEKPAADAKKDKKAAKDDDMVVAEEKPERDTKKKPAKTDKADDEKKDEKADEKKADEKKADEKPMADEKKDEKKADEKKDEKADEKKADEKKDEKAETPGGKVEGVDKKLARQWEDLLHYIKIAQLDAAKAAAATFTDGSVQPKDIYQLSEEYPDSRTVIIRGQQLEGMQEFCKKLHALIEDGYQVVRSDPKVIAATIEMLGGSLRAYELAVRRLQQSGEFAMPQLVQKLGASDTSELIKVRIVTALPHMGNECVRAMSMALQVNKPDVQEILCNTLGRIGYIHCAPQLKELAEAKDTLPRVKNAALLALETVAGPAALKKSVSELYYDMATKYYYQDDSVRPDPRYALANVWYWEPNLGLSYKPVVREIFCDIYAMRCSRLALQHDEKFFPAISLWLSAYLKKEADLPKGATDPIKGADQQAARFYALASSAEFLQQVLARALRDNNIPVALGSINALTETSGADNLVRPSADGTQPLVEALTYRDRRVRFLAAVSLASALPGERFTGYEVVMNVLNEALRQGGKKKIAIIATAPEVRNAYKQAVRDAGFEVIEGADAIKTLCDCRASGGIDGFVLCKDPDPIQVIGLIRSDPLLASLPVVVQARNQQLKDLAGIDKRVVLVDPLAPEAEISKAVTAAAVESQPLTEKDAADWAVRAAKTVRHVALGQSKVYDVLRTMQSLIGDLGHPKPEIQIAAAEALAIMNTPEAQQGLVVLAIKADMPENVRIAAFEAAAESVRRYGRLVTEPQAKAVLDVVMGKGSPALLDAAAKLSGAMNLPSQDIKPLILKTEGMD